MSLVPCVGSGPPPDLDRILADACGQAGIPARRSRLLRHFANAVYLIEDVPVVVRVAYGPGAVERSRTAITVAHWLAAIGFPATEPARPPGQHQPAIVEASAEVAVSFWRYYPQPADTRQHDPRTLGKIARSLHALDATPPTVLKPYQPLRSIATAVNMATTLDRNTRQWLEHRINQLLHEYDALEFPLGVGLIHADVYTGNLLWNVNGPTGDPVHSAVVLGDWDSVCLGPREIDLAPTFTATRFGLDRESVDRFATGYGYDLRDWAGYPTLRAMRELSTLTALVRLAPAQPAAARELRHRLHTLQTGQTHTVWTAQ